MSYGYFSKYDCEVMRVFQIREHHAKIVKLGRYDISPIAFLVGLYERTGRDNELPPVFAVAVLSLVLVKCLSSILKFFM